MRRGAKKLVDVKAYAHHVEYVECRLWAHSWKLNGPLSVTSQGIEWPLRCQRCGARRLDVTSKRDGKLNDRAYKMPKDYVWKGVGQQKPKHHELRYALAQVLMNGRRKK